MWPCQVQHAHSEQSCTIELAATNAIHAVQLPPGSLPFIRPFALSQAGRAPSANLKLPEAVWLYGQALDQSSCTPMPFPILLPAIPNRFVHRPKAFQIVRMSQIPVRILPCTLSAVPCSDTPAISISQHEQHAFAFTTLAARLVQTRGTLPHGRCQYTGKDVPLIYASVPFAFAPNVNGLPQFPPPRRCVYHKKQYCDTADC